MGGGSVISGTIWSIYRRILVEYSVTLFYKVKSWVIAVHVNAVGVQAAVKPAVNSMNL